MHVCAKTGTQMLKGVLFTAAESGSNPNAHLLANGDTECGPFTHRDVLPPYIKGRGPDTCCHYVDGPQGYDAQ